MIGTLPILLIEAHSRCNCRCVMCDIWKREERREFSPDQLERQMESIERLGVRWVVLTGGEPLMHSDLFALAAPLRARGMRVSVVSTGLLFARYARQIAGQLDDAIVSIDGPAEVHDRIRRVPGGFAQIARGIAAIHDARADFRIAIRCVVQKANHQSLRATVDAARAVGAASVSFLAADLRSTAFNREPPWSVERQAEVALTAEETDALEREIEAVVGDPLVADTPRHLRRIVRHFRAHLGLEAAEAPRCNAPWVSAVLGVDGSVKPCFFHGAMGTGELYDIVNSPRAQAFRAGLDVARDATCRRCVCSLHLEKAAG